MIKLIKKIVRPTSANEDSARREFILNVLLLGSILLALAAFLACFTIVSLMILRHEPLPDYFSFYATGIIAIIFIGLLVLSKLGFSKLASYVYIALYFIPTTYAAAVWGVEMPQGLIMYALIIVASGVLVGTYFAWTATGVISTVIVLLSILQSNGIIHPDLYWRDQMAKLSDAIVFVITLFIITIVSWLSNREIERSLIRARKSEAELKKERDLLEVRVEERTKELKQAQLEKMSQMAHFAEFGRLASGIFHDLSNPLTAIALNLEQLKGKNIQKLVDAKPYLDHALKATKRVEAFASAVRKQIQQQEVKAIFSPREEIKQVISILAYKAQKNNVSVNFKSSSERIRLFGNPLKFHQLASNIISNAIDALDLKKDGSKNVDVSLAESNNKVRLEVADNGSGIDKENLEKIFDPFFTTKDVDRGTGLGLPIVKEIVKNDFKGKIKIESAENKGTRFIIDLPKLSS